LVFVPKNLSEHRVLTDKVSVHVHLRADREEALAAHHTAMLVQVLLKL
jgi:hypothetical protein